MGELFSGTLQENPVIAPAPLHTLIFLLQIVLVILSPQRVFKASKAPCFTLRGAAPSGAPRQAPLELRISGSMASLEFPNVFGQHAVKAWSLSIEERARVEESGSSGSLSRARS